MKEEIQSLVDAMSIKDNCTELIDDAIGMLMMDPVATKNLVTQIGKMPILVKDAFYWYKFYMFVTGVRKIEDDIDNGVKLSSKLFDNPKNRERNGMRLLGYVDRADSEQKVNYYINATRSLLMGCIVAIDYFRIMKAVSETLNEDLEYLAKIAANTNVLKGNIQLLALERSGLVIQAGIDANESIESQDYVVSNLGRMVDKYAISLEDDEHQQYYKNEVEQHKLEVDLPTATKQDIDKLFP